MRDQQKNTNNTYKAALRHWDINKSFLVCKKIVSKTSYGRVFTGYEVLRRGTFVNGEIKYTNSLKGCYYNETELRDITEFNG